MVSHFERSVVGDIAQGVRGKFPSARVDVLPSEYAADALMIRVAVSEAAEGRVSLDFVLTGQGWAYVLVLDLDGEGGPDAPSDRPFDFVPEKPTAGVPRLVEAFTAVVNQALAAARATTIAGLPSAPARPDSAPPASSYPPTPAPAAVDLRRHHPLPIVGLVLGLIVLPIPFASGVGAVLSLVALLLSLIAFFVIDHSRYKGKGIAIGGIVAGAVGLFAFLTFLWNTYS